VEVQEQVADDGANGESGKKKKKSKRKDTEWWTLYWIMLHFSFALNF
jgi:hypothetical protein